LNGGIPRVTALENGNETKGEQKGPRQGRDTDNPPKSGLQRAPTSV